MRGRLRFRRRFLASCGTVALISCRALTDPGGSTSTISDAPASTSWSNVAAGTYNNCATDTEGRAYCWGFDAPQICDNTGCSFSRALRALSGALRFVAIEVGGPLVCGLTALGEMYCWGGPAVHSLGDGATTTSAVPMKVPIVGTVAQISAGFSRTCALNTEGAMYCWGLGEGALGAGPGIAVTRVPLLVRTTVAFREISVGNTQTCAIDVSDDAYCWGNGYGSLGIGVRDSSCAWSPACGLADTPLLVDGGLKWAHISAGNAFTCGLTRDALGYCWGDVQNVGDVFGPSGALGIGALRGSKVPVAVVGGHRFKSIRAGTRQACGVATDGTAYCWGVNDSGQIGIGRTDLDAYSPGGGRGRYPTPQPVVGGLRFESVSAGENSCGVTVGQNLFCWGSNYGGLLGAGSTAFYANVPTRVANPAK